jgi:hypothetical protein
MGDFAIIDIVINDQLREILTGMSELMLKSLISNIPSVARISEGNPRSPV